jgi:tetratricopeptide (TPR) repeat protein
MILHMKKSHWTLIPAMAATLFSASAQNPYPPFDARHWGVVLDHPDTKKVSAQKNIVYLQDEKGTLKFDLYLPPGLKPGEKRPAVVFLNGIGEQDNEPKVKDWAIYSSWPALTAAHGLIGISMESDGARIQESIGGLFKFLSEKGANHNIDAEHLGVYAASANVRASSAYLMGDQAWRGVKAAVLYYGQAPQGPFRKDLPVLFLVAEGDVNGNNYAAIWGETLKNNAPWTIKMASNLPHGFDAFEDTDEARTAVKETISFWKNHLESAPKPSWEPSPERAIVSASYWRHWDRVIDLSKQWLKTHAPDEGLDNIMASALLNSGKFGEVEPVYAKNLAKDPQNSGLLMQMTKIKYGLGQVAEARRHFETMESLAKTPDRFYYTFMTGFLYNRKMHDECVFYYSKAVKLFNNPTDYYNLACNYALTGDKDKAFEALEQAARLGFNERKHYENDEDLVSLRADERFKKLLERLQ